MKNKLLSVLLTLCMVLSLLPVTAEAATYYNVWVAGVQVTSDNMTNVLGDGTVSYTAATGSEAQTLTLNNAAIAGNYTTGDYTCGIFADGKLNITLADGSSNTVTGADGKKSCGIYATGDLCFLGGGDLTVSSGTGTAESYGLYSGSGITFLGSGTINTQGGEAPSSSYGMAATNFIQIIIGTVTVNTVSTSGTARAMNKMLSNDNIIENNYAVTASTNANEIGAVGISSATLRAKLGTYKYLKFTPFTPAAPTAKTTDAADVTKTSATLTGTVNGQNAPTTVTFEYGTDTSYGKTVTATQSIVTGIIDTLVSFNLTGLSTGVTYHYRVKATSTQGTVYGEDMIFTTLSTKSIAVKAGGQKIAYKLGDTLDVTSLKIIVTFSDNSTSEKAVTPDMVSGFDSSAATENQTLTITFDGRTTTYNISIARKAYSGTSADAPTLNSRTDTKVTLNVVNVSGQAIEYAKSNTTTAPTNDNAWQDSTTFDGLTGGTVYYFFARVKKTSHTEAGGVSDGLSVTTKTTSSTVELPTIGTGDDRPTNISITITTKIGQEYYISESASAPNDWSTAIHGDGNMHKFTNLKENTKYYIYVRVAETDTAMSSAPEKVEQYTQPATPNSSVVTINYANETISYSSQYEVFTKNDGTGTEITGAITPGTTEQTIYVRVKAVVGGAPASEWRAVTIPARPVMGTTLTVDYSTEKVTVPAGYSCQIGSGSVIDVTGGIQAISLEPSEILTYWKTATGSSFRSEKATITAPARLAHSAAAINFIAETINTTTSMEYSTDGGITWTGCRENMSISDFIKSTDQNIKIREKATDSYYASEVQTLSIAARATAPNAGKTDETISGKKDGKLTSVTDAMEYKLATDTTWMGITGTEVSNLDPGTYHIRYKATDRAVYSNFQEITIEAADKITLNFDSQGGSAVNDITDLVFHQTVTPPETTRTGYTFMGWWANSDGTGTELTATTQIEASVTYYAKWAANSYIITFKANGGLGGDVVQSFTYDEAAKALNDNAFTRTDYTFSGWNTAENGTGTSYANAQSVRNLLTESGANLDLYAQWAEAKCHNLSGEVKDDASPAVAVTGAAVTLKQGAAIIATTQTDGQGKYSFTNLLPGTYNLVVTKDDKTTTVIYVVAKADSTQNYIRNITLPTAATNNSALVVEKEAGITEEVPKIVVGGLDTVAASQNADITMTVTQKVEDKENLTQAAIKEATKGQSLSMYLDVELKKGTDPLTNSGNVLELIFPYSFASKTDVKVWRVHGGSIDAFEELKTKATGSFLDKTFYLDKENGLIYVYANKFSTYAISYTSVSSGGKGSSGGGSSYNYYTITATAGAGGSISPSGSVSIREGLSKIFTFAPASGYQISDILVDGKSIGMKNNYTFEKVQKGHTITVSFKKTEYDNPTKSFDFEDVVKKDWFYESVMNATEKGWFKGTSETTFGPYLDTTRCMIVTTLQRMEKGKAVNEAMFSDVKADSYYANAVAWANENKIVEGYGNGKFGPLDTITREQLAAILYRYASWKGYDVSKTTALDSFNDGSSTSGYAKKAMGWAVANELVSGTGNGILGSRDKATRAQVAAILTRFDKLFPAK